MTIRRRKSKGFHKQQRRHNGQQKLLFKIAEMDALGQGVFKDTEDGQPVFIAKTLPQESGTCTVYAQRKGVKFARLESLEDSADNRIEAQCPHFDKCPACHYLHTDYDSELNYKKANFERTFQALLNQHGGAHNKVEIKIVAAPARFAYRNRIQLHYRHQYLGMLDGRNDQVIEIPHCQVVDPKIAEVLESLYVDKSWSKQLLQQNEPKQGHCELYLRDGKVETSWNQPYASGGFTQVNPVMNDLLKQEVMASFAAGAMTEENMANKNNFPKSILDLFSGSGNLSEDLLQSDDVNRVMVDYSSDKALLERDDFIHLDLFSSDALKRFKPQNSIKQFNLMIVDPPRKGFPALKQWGQQYKPDTLIYVSCHAATLSRDLTSLDKKYQLKKLVMLDLFPGTYHYETIAVLSRKQS